jgi:hypothetical protein
LFEKHHVCQKNQLQLLSDKLLLSDVTVLPQAARLDAFIRAILNAPVKLEPKPKRMANAGTIIIDATAKPVPNSKEPLLLFLTADRANS